MSSRVKLWCVSTFVVVLLSYHCIFYGMKPHNQIHGITQCTAGVFLVVNITTYVPEQLLNCFYHKYCCPSGHILDDRTIRELLKRNQPNNLANATGFDPWDMFLRVCPEKTSARSQSPLKNQRTHPKFMPDRSSNGRSLQPERPHNTHPRKHQGAPIRHRMVPAL